MAPVGPRLAVRDSDASYYYPRQLRGQAFSRGLERARFHRTVVRERGEPSRNLAHGCFMPRVPRNPPLRFRRYASGGYALHYAGRFPQVTFPTHTSRDCQETSSRRQTRGQSKRSSQEVSSCSRDSLRVGILDSNVLPRLRLRLRLRFLGRSSRSGK